MDDYKTWLYKQLRFPDYLVPDSDMYINSLLQFSMSTSKFLEKKKSDIDYILYYNIFCQIPFETKKYNHWCANYYMLAQYLIHEKGVSKGRVYNLDHHKIEKLYQNLRLRDDNNAVDVLNKIETAIKTIDYKISLELTKEKYKRDKKHLRKLFGIKKSKIQLLQNKLLDFSISYKKSTGIYEYRKQCEFNITSDNIKYIKGYDKLQRLGFYHPYSNPHGCVKDHMLSIFEGWINNYPVSIVGSIYNCEFLTVKENCSKNSKSSISFIELRDKVKISLKNSLNN